jgi:zinc protease
MHHHPIPTRRPARCLAGLTLLVSLPFAANLVGQETATRVAPRPWEHETSDLAPDPGYRFGALDNGLRYAIREGAEPKHRVFLWLHVDVGSLAEEEHERGMAHFLEHMAFNGSENFPAGTLVEWLQERGLDFGAHSNAYTSFNETVYTFNLPTADENSLREGLLVLSDIAGRLTLSQEEIDAEKGVIDGEERERDSAGMRMQLAALEKAFAGSRIAERLPIGKKEARDAFDHAKVHAFWKKWYRPDTMTLVVAGDLQGFDPVPLIEAAFGDLETPDAPRPVEPEPGGPNLEEPFFAVYEAEVPQVSIDFSRVEPYVKRPYDSQELVADLPLEVAFSMLNRRYAEKTRSGQAPYLSARGSLDEALDAVRGVSLSVSAEAGRWEEAFVAAELELRAALEYGFQDEELRVVRADALRGLDESVERKATVSSGAHARTLVRAAERPYVPIAPETARDVLKPAYEALTVEACKQALVAAFARGTETMQVLGGIDLGPTAADSLRAALDKAREQKPEKPAELSSSGFAYHTDPAVKGEIASRGPVGAEEFGIERVVFGNGVVAYLKKTDFKAREVLLSAAIGEGELASDPKDQAMRSVANSLLSGAGLTAHSPDDLRRLLAGKRVGARLGVGGDSLEVGGSASSEDLLLQLELMRAHVTDLGWREDGLLRMRRQLPQMFEGASHQPGWMIATRFEPALMPGDPRFAFPSLEERLAVEPAAIREFVAPQLADGPITMAVVGDFEPDAAVAALAQTFGTLPPRRALERHADRRKVPEMKQGLRLEESVETEVPKALVVVAFPTDDGFDAARRRDLSFLGRVVNDRVRLVIREKMGASYSPGAGEDSSRIYEGLGRIAIQAAAEPEQAAALVDAAIEVAADVGAKGVTEDEVKRLKEPLLKDLRDSRRNNGFWVGVLSMMHTDPQALDDVATAEAYYEQLDAEHVSAVAAKYLVAERASTIVVTPKSAAKPEAPAAGSEDGAR